MYGIKKFYNKKLGIYIRKENNLENFSSEYGRLQWLKYELESYKGDIIIYKDEYKRNGRLLELLNDIRNGKVEALLIWSIQDVEIVDINKLVDVCNLIQVPIISFCETAIGLNAVISKYVDGTKKESIVS